MGWVYLVKRSGVTVHPSYLRPCDKFNGSHEEAVQYGTKGEAEAKAFLIVANHPEWIGLLSVVRSAPF